MNPARAAILLAFHDEYAVLTKHQILERAGLGDDRHIGDLMQMSLIGQKEWQPNAPRLYYLTARGRDKRDECNVGD